VVRPTTLVRPVQTGGLWIGPDAMGLSSAACGIRLAQEEREPRRETLPEETDLLTYMSAISVAIASAFLAIEMHISRFLATEQAGQRKANGTILLTEPIQNLQ
jgi:hypothetical protein